MQLTMNNVRILPAQMVTRKETSRLESEVAFMGGKITVQNPKKTEGEFSVLTVEVDLDNEAQAWAAKDGRKGAFVGTAIRFGAIVEATPLKK